MPGYRKPRGVPLRIGLGKSSYSQSLEGAAHTLNKQFRDSMEDLEKNLADFIREVEGTMPEALVEALEPTFQKSQEYCPKDSGALVNSGYLETRRRNRQTIVEMGYARGGHPHYAVYVHERTQVKHEEPTRAKFLESAIDEDYFSIITRLAQAVRNRAGT